MKRPHSVAILLGTVSVLVVAGCGSASHPSLALVDQGGTTTTLSSGDTGATPTPGQAGATTTQPLTPAQGTAFAPAITRTTRPPRTTTTSTIPPPPSNPSCAVGASPQNPPPDSTETVLFTSNWPKAGVYITFNFRNAPLNKSVITGTDGSAVVTAFIGHDSSTYPVRVDANLNGRTTCTAFFTPL